MVQIKLIEEAEMEEEKYRCCPLSDTRRTIVWWRGTAEKNVDILFVGEAPGREEDIQGKPFVGRAGRLLDTWIEEIGVEKYAIVNIIKCRPPNNRKPNKLEIEACLPLFINQLKELNPKVIIALGAIPSSVLVGRTEVVSNIGKIFKTKFGKVMIFPHPAYISRGVDVEVPIEKLKQVLKVLKIGLNDRQ